MALSSNWLKLQKSKQVSIGKTLKKNKKLDKINGIRRDANGNNARISKPKQKGSKIMEKVYSMNKEIAKAEQDKKDGKIFEFKSEKLIVDVHPSTESAAGANSIENNKDSKRAQDIGKYLAMDCEFVGVGLEGKESALARLSMVNYFGHVILDVFVKPREKVTDWRTWVSGIKPEHMKEAISFKEAQNKTAALLDGRILVGHSIKHDLEALLLSHPKPMIRDTSRHLPFRQTYAKGKTPSLKKLAKEVLKQEIQDGQHSSVEDARITMLLYKSEKKEFEKLHKATYGFTK